MLESCHTSPYGGHHKGEHTAQNVLQSGFYLPKWVEAVALTSNDAKVVVKFI